MKKRKAERYGAVDRTFEIKLDKPVRGLRAVKALIVILLAATVVGTVILGAKFYWSGDTKRQTAETEAVTDSALNDELLRVVNKTNSLDKTYVPKLSERDGYSVSVLADEPLNALLKTAGEKGIELSVKSAYISYSDQNKLYKNAIKHNRKTYNLCQIRVCSALSVG